MKKLFELLGALSMFKSRGDPLREGFTPYVDAECNRTYNLLFCDKLELFRRALGAEPEGVWETVLARQPYVAGLRAIAENRAQRSELRLLAYHRLRSMRQPVREKLLLGAVVEVGSEEGLDVVAAYDDGQARFIDKSENIVNVEARRENLSSDVSALLDAAQAAVDRIGPWLKPRVAPPTSGMVRMSFLVSDGLYFGQGLLDTMKEDELARPIIEASDTLRRTIAIVRKSRS